MYAKRPNGFAPAWRKAGPQGQALRPTQPHGVGRFISFTRNAAAAGQPPAAPRVQHARTGCDDHGSDYDQIHWQILLCN